MKNVSSFNLNFNKNNKIPTIKLDSGYEIPVIGFGTWSLHKDICINAVKTAILNGYRLFDTAHIYENKIEIGKAIRE